MAVIQSQNDEPLLTRIGRLWDQLMGTTPQQEVATESQSGTVGSGDSYQKPTPKESSGVLQASVGLTLVVAAALTIKLRPSHNLNRLVRSLERDILLFVTERASPPNLGRAEREALRLHLDNLLMQLSQTENDLPIARQFVRQRGKEILFSGILPNFRLAGRIRRGPEGNTLLTLLVEAPENTMHPNPRLRRMVIDIPVEKRKGVWGHIIDLPRKNQSCSRTFIDDDIQLPLRGSSAIRRSHLGLAEGEDPMLTLSAEKGFRFVAFDKEGLERWSPLLAEATWPTGLKGVGHFPQPVYYSNQLSCIPGGIRVSPASAAEAEFFFPVASTTPTPWATNREVVECGALYQFNRHGRLQGIALVERNAAGEIKTLLGAEYVGAELRLDLPLGQTHPSPVIGLGELEALVSPHLGPFLPVSSDGLLPHIRRRLRELLLPALQREETTLPVGFSVVIPSTRMRPTEMGVLNISGSYQQREGQWHLDIAIERLIQPHPGEPIQSTSASMSVSIRRVSGHLSLNDLIENRPAPQQFEDPLRLLTSGYLLEAGGRERVVFRRSLFGSRATELHRFYTATGLTPRFSEDLFLRWGEAIDTSPVRAFVMDEGRRLPNVVQTTDEMAGILRTAGFPYDRYASTPLADGSRHTFQLATVDPLPWATSRDPIRLQLIYEFDAQGRFRSLSLAEAKGNQLTPGLVLS
ncbi:MAG: hypothetical protein HYT76_07650 [Deltaproteobacteria bacterium]|nr:hypothetical protein [Deltaproteobacteria bacterium]